MRNLIIIKHPLIARDLTILRDRRTPSERFRAILHRISLLIAYEVTRELPLRPVSVTTPLARAKGSEIDKSVVLVPVLRAGLGLVAGFIQLIPNAKVGHIGLYRDEETLKPVDYYFNVPRNLRTSLVFVLDPMLATGGSGAAAISYLKEKGARSVKFVCLVAAPEGVRTVAASHPDVVVYTCALDLGLNEKGYILPGLGDAGDRVFGTE